MKKIYQVIEYEFESRKGQTALSAFEEGVDPDSTKNFETYEEAKKYYDEIKVYSSKWDTCFGKIIYFRNTAAEIAEIILDDDEKEIERLSQDLKIGVYKEEEKNF